MFKLKLMLAYILALISFILVVSCGQDSSGSLNSSDLGVSGIFVDSTVNDSFKVKFREVKECLNFLKGNYEDLSIIIRTPSFPCQSNSPLTCSGKFTSPNIINTEWTMISLKHEFIHYLLLINTGDMDKNHENKFFMTCIHPS